MYPMFEDPGSNNHNRNFVGIRSLKYWTFGPLRVPQPVQDGYVLRAPQVSCGVFPLLGRQASPLHVAFGRSFASTAGSVKAKH